jgi:farnesyl diphosphate synthase
MNAVVEKSLPVLIESFAARVQNILQQRLPSGVSIPTTLHEAMRYAVMNGGKRIRPALVYATGEAVGLKTQQLDITAAAVEIIHCYSLIHDDLPAMDNDDLRRGIPTCHRAFDEATAILAGDALQALAFEILCDFDMPGPPAATRSTLVNILARCSGSHGMAGGQALDLAVVGRSLSNQELELMHMKKTGSLIHGCIMMAAACAHSLPEQQQQALSQFGQVIGLAFQIRDDILDEISDTQSLGKPQGSDSANNKPTYVSQLGLEAAQTQCEFLLQKAHDALIGFDAKADCLRRLADYIIAREY